MSRTLEQQIQDARIQIPRRPSLYAEAVPVADSKKLALEGYTESEIAELIKMRIAIMEKRSRDGIL